LHTEVVYLSGDDHTFKYQHCRALIQPSSSSSSSQYYQVVASRPNRYCCCVQMLALNDDNSDVAHQRMEDIILLAITSLASLTFLPLAPIEPRNNIKAKVAESFGNVLCQPSLANVSADYLLLLSHPGTCATILKVFRLMCGIIIVVCKAVSFLWQKL